MQWKFQYHPYGGYLASLSLREILRQLFQLFHRHLVQCRFHFRGSTQRQHLFSENLVYSHLLYSSLTDYVNCDAETSTPIPSPSIKLIVARIFKAPSIKTVQKDFQSRWADISEIRLWTQAYVICPYLILSCLPPNKSLATIPELRV